MKLILLIILIGTFYYILKKLFFETKIGKSIKHRKTTLRRINKLKQRQIEDSDLKSNIVNDVKSKTGFDLSEAKLMVHIDYSTIQLGSQEEYFIADDIKHFIDQAKMLDFEFADIVIDKFKLGSIIRLIIKAQRNNRVSLLTSRNNNILSSFGEDTNFRCAGKGYYLSERGGDEYNQGNVSIKILPELSLIIVTQFHW